MKEIVNYHVVCWGESAVAVDFVFDVVGFHVWEDYLDGFHFSLGEVYETVSFLFFVDTIVAYTFELSGLVGVG